MRELRTQLAAKAPGSALSPPAVRGRRARGRAVGALRHLTVGRRVVAALALVLVVTAALPSAAGAHATLSESTPARGAQLERAPARVVLRFDEPVEAAFGSVRVFDQHGGRVDRGPTERPGGRSDAVAIGLERVLGDGTYTVTYRVVSADSHPVAGGYVFTVGRGGAPVESVEELLDVVGGAGPATEIGFGIARALSYLAIALAIGGAVFLVTTWRAAIARLPAGGEAPRGSASTAAAARSSLDPFARRARALALTAVALGIAATVLGIVFQGAVASGGTFWSALDTTVVNEVLHTRFGTVWGLRLLAWVALYAIVAAYPRAQSLAVGPGPALLAFLAVTPALAGHAATTDPSWLLVPANVVHVVAMSVWVGGVAMFLIAVPAATRSLAAGADRTRLLAVLVSRFSTVALLAVAALVAGGVIQAVAELDAPADLLDTPFGRAILIKIAIVVVLIALGAWNRRRARPRLEALVNERAAPGMTGVALRRSLRAEIALMLAALGVTAALVAYAPATAATTGPFSTDAEIGPARMDLTVDPARAGSNEIHVYLFDRRTGRQWDRVKELTVDAALAERDVGPLPLDVEKTGPGHYTIRSAPLAPAGEWTLRAEARVSEFDEYTARVQVPIR